MFSFFLEKINKHPVWLFLIGLATILGIVFQCVDRYMPEQTEEGDNLEQSIKQVMVDSVEKTILPEPIFNLVKKISAESITLNKEKILADSLGLFTTGVGYVEDVTKVDKLEVGEFRYSVSIVEKLGDNLMIQCWFTDEWGKSLSLLKKADQIKFQGKIMGGKNYNGFFKDSDNIPLVLLGRCVLLE